MKNLHSTSQSVPVGNRRRGFTLVELLVVVIIIAALAALSTVGLRRARFAAAKVKTTTQMHQISIGVTTWAAEKNLGEPFYAANGTGTFGYESAPGPKPELAPGNPGILLYNVQSPDEGYLTDFTLFFCPLVKAKAPSRSDYKPETATTDKPWGTYSWFYPANAAGQLTARQNDAMGQNWAVTKITPAAKGKLLMANEYKTSLPIWDKHFLALMIDGSISQVAQTDTGWDRWAWGP